MQKILGPYLDVARRRILKRKPLWVRGESPNDPLAEIERELDRIRDMKGGISGPGIRPPSPEKSGPGR